MSIRQVRELPKTSGAANKGKSYVAKDVRDFIRMGYEFAVVEVEGRKDSNVVAALMKYVKAHPDQCRGIKCVMRGGKPYLVREVTR